MAQRPQCHPNLRTPVEAEEDKTGVSEQREESAAVEPGAAVPASQPAGVGSEPEQPTTDPAA